MENIIIVIVALQIASMPQLPTEQKRDVNSPYDLTLKNITYPRLNSMQQRHELLMRCTNRQRKREREKQEKGKDTIIGKIERRNKTNTYTNPR